MKKWTENYGEDADGNRGKMRDFYEIEASDYDTIQPQVEEYLQTLNEDQDPDEFITVVLIDPETGEDVYLEVCVREVNFNKHIRSKDVL